jgi:hypothetical protein
MSSNKFSLAEIRVHAILAIALINLRATLVVDTDGIVGIGEHDSFLFVCIVLLMSTICTFRVQIRKVGITPHTRHMAELRHGKTAYAVDNRMMDVVVCAKVRTARY